MRRWRRRRPLLLLLLLVARTLSPLCSCRRWWWLDLVFFRVEVCVVLGAWERMWIGGRIVRTALLHQLYVVAIIRVSDLHGCTLLVCCLHTDTVPIRYADRLSSQKNSIFLVPARQYIQGVSQLNMVINMLSAFVTRGHLLELVTKIKWSKILDRSTSQIS